MGSIIFTGRKSISETAKAVTWVADADDMVLGATGRVQHKGEKGVDLLIGKVPPNEIQKDKAQVETIKINTALVKGCDYKNNGALRDGMVLDKKYELEVVKFKNDKAPASDNDIRWAFRYENEDGVQQGEFPGRGRKVLLNISDVPEICGRGLTLYAYISDKTKEGVINTWVHYRYRFFPRELVKNEAQKRTTDSWLIDQGGTPLCGMALIFYLFAKHDAAGYEKMVLELHQTGKSKYNNYVIEPDDIALYDMDPAGADYPGSIKTLDKKMPRVDWITMVTARNKESNFNYLGKRGQEASGINLASMIVKFKKELLGYTDVVDRSDVFMNPTLGDKLDWLIEMQKAYQNGYNVSMLIDSDMLDDKPSYFAAADNPFAWRFHWIIYEGDLFVDEPNDAYVFSYWCWGDPVRRKRSFKRSNFNTNYYGYIKGK